MRKKFISGKRKAIVTSVLTVVIMCLAATAVPTIQGNTTQKILTKHEYLENNCDNVIENLYQLLGKQDKITIGYLLSLAKNNLPTDKKILTTLIDRFESTSTDKFDLTSIELPICIFSIYEELFGVRSASKIDLIQAIKNKIIPVNNEIHEIISGRKRSDEMSTELQNTLSIISQNDLNSDFEKYWIDYEDALGIWLTDPEEMPDWPYIQLISKFPMFTHDNYEDWWQDYNNTIEGQLYFYALLIVIGVLILFFSPIITLSGLALNFIGALFVAFILYLSLSLVTYLTYSFSLFNSLVGREVEILINVTDNETGTGIQNLYLDQGIKVYNTDAYKKCNNDSGKTKFFFTYYLGPADFVKDGENGWYSLKMRNIAEEQPLYKKAPCPPGNWTVQILSADDYDYVQPPPINFTISSRETVIEHVTLIPRT